MNDKNNEQSIRYFQLRQSILFNPRYDTQKYKNEMSV